MLPKDVSSISACAILSCHNAPVVLIFYEFTVNFQLLHAAVCMIKGGNFEPVL